MIGNAGKYKSSDPDQVKLLQTILNYNNNKKGIIFLGNNFYPDLSDVLSDEDELENKTSDLNLDSLQRFDGPLCFVPGWSDWSYGTSNGKEMVKWEYEAIHEHLKNKDVYMPEAACPGPVEVQVNDSLTILLLDTQWWLHPFDTRFGKCDLEDESDPLFNLRDALRRNRNKEVVVAGYHPVISYGEYGGYYPPLEEIFGFPVVLYRKYLGTRLDLAHPDYKKLSENLKSILEKFPNVIYASSHEKNFQYLEKDSIHYIIGGSLTGGKYIKEKKLECGSQRAGYTRLDFFQDGRVELLFFPLNDPQNPSCKNVLYTYKARDIREVATKKIRSMPDSISQAASSQYSASSKTRKWLGKNYREVWRTPVKAPVFNIEKEQGGLEILKRGGGQQTNSLRLKDSTGHEYALRSLEKNVEGALPKTVKNTFAVDLVQDNISASNPYAAMPVASLAERAGIMHTNPKVVYVPRDYRLGEYMEDVAGHLFLFEERPDDDWSGKKSFGYSSKIVGTDDVIEKTGKDPEHQADQQAVLKARLFDTFINDWDRHDDQWRWASFKKNGKTTYRPIPRDRDQAFYVNEGILPWIAARKWLLPKLQGFAAMTPNMAGLVFNARYFDRTFLTEPDWQEWKLTVDTLQNLLTDQAIDQAMKTFPEEIQPLCADTTAEILKKRRDNLELMARQHYLILAENVNVTGTNKDDLFELTRKDDQQTEVSVYELSKTHTPEQRYYHRVFLTGETKEIRLYGFNGDDLFRLDGQARKGIRIRVIGGKGKDTIMSQSSVKEPGKHTFIYDRKKNTISVSNKDTRNQLSHSGSINHYDRKDFHYDVVSPGIFTGYNEDDGVFIGGGPVFNQYRFRRHNTQSVMANFATLTNAFNIRYNFDSESRIPGFDHHFGAELKAPDYIMNYFGMGNESDKIFGDSYYRLRVNQLILNYALGHRWGKTAFNTMKGGSVNQSDLSLGVFFKRSNVEVQEGDFISDLAHNGLTNEELDHQLFTGIYGQYTYSNLNQEINPQRGLKLMIDGEQFFQLDNDQDHFLRMNADLRAYISFTEDPRSVLALRIGGTRVFGNYPFLEAAKLGGKTNLRGYLADRFYGDDAIYQNTEFRYKLLDFSSYILNGELGVLAFYDSGRVWLDDEDSDHWHKGYGSGFWISPFEMAIFTATYNWSKDDKLLQVTLNFKF